MTDPVASAWDRASDDWIRWARTPGHDHFFWSFVRPEVLELLPAPGRLTVDLGCGEGRLARELVALGHRVVGVEPSPRLAAAAGEAEPSVTVLVADAADLTLEDGAADLVVSSMSLLNIAHLDRALREVARVLEPGGRFVFATAHPISTAARAYFDEVSFSERRERGGLEMTFTDVHRPLRAIAGAVLRAALLIEALDEPVPSDAYVREHPEVERWRDRPVLLTGRALKPAA